MHPLGSQIAHNDCTTPDRPTQPIYPHTRRCPDMSQFMRHTVSGLWSMDVYFWLAFRVRLHLFHVVSVRILDLLSSIAIHDLSH